LNFANARAEEPARLAALAAQVRALLA